MGHITLFTLPEPGHLFPTFRIADTLRRRGHNIRYVSFPQFETDIRSLGFAFSGILGKYIENICDSESLLETRHSGSQIYQSLFPQLQREGPAVIADIIRTISSCPVDLLIIDSGLRMLDGAFSGYSKGTAPVSNALQCLACSFLRISATFTEVYEVFPISDFFRSLPELVLCPKVFDLPTAPPSRHECHFVEPSVFTKRAPVAFPWNWIDPSRKLVYCSLGTQSQNYHGAIPLLRHMVKAFGSFQRFQMVMTVGGHCDPAVFGHLPDNVFLCKSAPQLQLLERTSVAITHGGLGTIKEAILSGVPMLVVPFNVDQPFNARRVTHHGVGTAVLPRSIPEHHHIGQILEHLAFDKGLSERVRHLQHVFQRIEEASPSIMHIENLLNSQHDTKVSAAPFRADETTN